MITDRPCCDNCPHYAPNVSSDEVGSIGSCLFSDGSYPHVDPGCRCSHHPWIESATDMLISRTSYTPPPFVRPTTGSVSIEQSWKNYIAALPELLAVIHGEKPSKPVLPSEWWKLDACQVDLLSKEGAIIGGMNFEAFKAASRRGFRCTVIDEIVRGGCVDPFVVLRGRGPDGIFHDKPLMQAALLWFGPAPWPEATTDEAVERR